MASSTARRAGAIAARSFLFLALVALPAAAPRRTPEAAPGSRVARVAPAVRGAPDVSAAARAPRVPFAHGTLGRSTTVEEHAPQSGGVDFAGIGHDRGSDSARVHIIEFGDFGCGYCAQFFTDTYPRIDSAYISTGRVQWKFIPFVTGNFRNSREAAEAAECAAEQGAFWKMHDLLYTRRKVWMAAAQPRPLMARFAAEIRLDPAKFQRCSNGAAARQHIMHNDMLASLLALRGTPTFFVNGRIVPGAIPFDLFRQVIDAAAR